MADERDDQEFEPENDEMGRGDEEMIGADDDEEFDDVDESDEEEDLGEE